jgi:hypothetical protein
VLQPTEVGAPYARPERPSYVLQEFDGGPGQIAFHGLANVGGVLGTAVSHGQWSRQPHDALAVVRYQPRRAVTITR